MPSARVREDQTRGARAGGNSQVDVLAMFLLALNPSDVTQNSM